MFWGSFRGVKIYSKKKDFWTRTFILEKIVIKRPLFICSSHYLKLHIKCCYWAQVPYIFLSLPLSISVCLSFSIWFDYETCQIHKLYKWINFGYVVFPILLIKYLDCKFDNTKIKIASWYNVASPGLNPRDLVLEMLFFCFSVDQTSAMDLLSFGMFVLSLFSPSLSLSFSLSLSLSFFLSFHT